MVIKEAFSSESSSDESLSNVESFAINWALSAVLS